MGLFDLFKGKGKDGGEKKSNAAAKWAEAAGSKKAQTYDRQEAIQELCKLRTPEAVEALLRRFTFTTDPSITDEEEKQTVFDGIVASGRGAIEPVRAFAAKADSLAWPMRILRELLSEEEVIDELLVWLGKWDTDYAKFIDPKLQILAALAEFKNPKIRPATERFLEDVNDPARFHAAEALIKQGEPEAIGPLLTLLLDEESVRIRVKIADGFMANGWTVPDDQRDAVRKALPYEYGIDGSGHFTKRGG